MSTKTQTPQSPPALTFPAPLYAALSPHSFLQAHLSTSSSADKRKKPSPLRANGRSPTEFRTPGINTGSLSHCNGSAVVRIGNTAVVCGVRAEILSAEGDGVEIDDAQEDIEEADDDEIEALGLLVPNVELSTGSTPQYLPGNAPSQFAQTLVTRLKNLLVSTRVLHSRDLRILYTPPSTADDNAEPAGKKVVKAYWTLYIDTLFISLDGPSSAFDAAFIAILAALKDTRLPRAYWDQEAECVLCEEDVAQARRLNLRGLPVPCSYGVLEGEEGEEVIAGESDGAQKGWILSDPDAFEESVCAEGVCIVIDGSTEKNGKGGALRRIEKSGGGSAGLVDRATIKTLVGRSMERWRSVRDVLGRGG